MSKVSKDDRKCKCGEPASKHEQKSTATSAWRGKSLVDGSTCKRYKWARETSAPAPASPAPAAATA